MDRLIAKIKSLLCGILFPALYLFLMTFVGTVFVGIVAFADISKNGISDFNKVLERAISVYENHTPEIIIISAVMTAAAAVIILKLFGEDVKRLAGIRKPNVFIIIGAFAAGAHLNVLFSEIIDLVPVPEKWLELNEEAVSSVQSDNVILSFIAAALAAPLIEEFVMRGISFGFLKNNFSTAFAVTVTSVLFGILHGNILQMIYTALAGAFFCYFRIRGKSLFAGIAAHIGFNAAGLICSYMTYIAPPLRIVVSVAVIALIMSGVKIKDLK